MSAYLVRISGCNSVKNCPSARQISQPTQCLKAKGTGGATLLQGCEASHHGNTIANPVLLFSPVTFCSSRDRSHDQMRIDKNSDTTSVQSITVVNLYFDT